MSTADNTEFKFDNGEYVTVDGAYGQVVATAFFEEQPDAYRVQFQSGAVRWFYEDMISKTRKH